jgi:hypothetical protein
MSFQFCNVCYNTFTYAFHLPNQVQLADIEVQANGGCEQCSVIYSAVRQLFPSYVSNNEAASLVAIDIHRPGNIKVVWSNLSNSKGGEEEMGVQPVEECNSTWLNFYSLPGICTLLCMPWIEVLTD